AGGRAQGGGGEGGGAAGRLPLAAWEAEVTVSGVACVAGGLETFRRPPGAAAPPANAFALFPYSPRPRRQNTRSGRCAPARASCAGGQSRGRGITPAGHGRLRRRWDGRPPGQPPSPSTFPGTCHWGGSCARFLPPRAQIGPEEQPPF